MDFIRIGQIVNTHGIKGEIRILSDFKFKKDVFKKDMKVYIGRTKEEETINSYRVHKNYDMVTLIGLTDINDVIIYKGDDIYVNKSDIKVDGILDEDLIGMLVFSNNDLIGTVEEIMPNTANDILVVTKNNKRHLIPYIKEFVKNIDVENKRIEIEVIEGLIDED